MTTRLACLTCHMVYRFRYTPEAMRAVVTQHDGHTLTQWTPDYERGVDAAGTLYGLNGDGHHVPIVMNYPRFAQVTLEAAHH